MSVTSRRNYLRCVTRAYKWAVKQGYLEKNPIADLEVPTGERRDVFLPPEDFQTLCGLTADTNLQELMTVTYETGCRPQESLIVERRHVDVNNQRWVFPQREAKGKRAPRIVYLTEMAFEVSKRLMLQNPKGPIFRNTRGKPWTTAAVNCGFTRLQIRVGKQRMRENGVSISDEQIDQMIGTLSPTRVCKGQTITKSVSELKAEIAAG